ncbi:helix-turn-helix transcriptional regulator [Weissella viridescens]|uniref:helix-turn-helix transcriptional regulator n=1 Tax=Weissella viridescens TaxID=1629 RepID=UPI001C7D8A40|nr:helix-turn-helix transcriptional regulator [Weissella viridescens]MBX4173457.1 helix-turn-helix domain-containing protein [Weissella viridescens]
MNNFGEAIRKYRESNNLTQAELAEKLHVTRQTLSRWENGRSYPNLDTLVEISQLLDLSLDYLLTGKDNVLVESISGDVRSKKKYQYSFRALILLLISILLFLGILTFGRQTQNEKIDYLNPFLSTKVGYAILPDKKENQTRVDVYVMDDPVGNGEWLKIYTGAYNNTKQVALVRHKGSYAQVRIVNKSQVPNDMRTQLSGKYSSYHAKVDGPRLNQSHVWPWQ